MWSPAVEPEVRLGTDFFDDADEHPPRAGHRVVHLAPAPDDLEDLGADPIPHSVVLVEELAEAGGIEVEALDPDADLVGGQGRVRGQAIGGLRQDSGGFEHAVQSDR